MVTQEIRRCSKPDPVKTKGMNFANYDKLGDHTGIIPENTSFRTIKTYIIGKVCAHKEW